MWDLTPLWNGIVYAAVLSPAGAALLWFLWEAVIRPRLLPSSEITALAEKLLAAHGTHAEEFAFIEEDHAWRRSEPFEQGKWRRVRRELRRRAAAHDKAHPPDGTSWT